MFLFKILSKFHVFSLLIILSSESFSKDLGVGIVFGEPTGLTAKVWQEKDRALDFGLSYSFNSFLLFYGDYLLHFPGSFSHPKSPFLTELNPYLGLGAVALLSTDSSRSSRVLFADNNSSSVGMGARIPLGVEWIPQDTKFGIFVEIVPGLGIIPSMFAFLNLGIGARYYF